MIPDALLLHLAASFAAGFVIVALVTTLADMFGEGPAGFLGGLPSTGAVSFFSIGLTESPSAAVQATTLFPLGFAVTCAFLLFYTVPQTLRFWTRMAVALCLWFPAALGVAVWGPDDFVLSCTLAIVLAVGVFVTRTRVPTRRAGLVATKPSMTGALLRGTLGGSVVIVVVVVSMLGGPLVGGVFAAAPAIWSSSLYVTNRAQGLEFSRSLTSTFMQTGILTTIPYSVAARYLFEASGVWLGTLLAYVAISPLAYLAWRLANPRTAARKVNENPSSRDPGPDPDRYGRQSVSVCSDPSIDQMFGSTRNGLASAKPRVPATKPDNVR